MVILITSGAESGASGVGTISSPTSQCVSNIFQCPKLSDFEYVSGNQSHGLENPAE